MHTHSLPDAQWNELLATLVRDIRAKPSEATLSSATLPDFTAADREKVAPQILALRARASGGNLSPADAAHLERIRHKRHILAEEIAIVGRAASATAAAFVIQRGFAFQSYYPAEYIRQFNDLDIVVPDLATLDRLLPALFAQGYYIARPLVLCRSATPLPWVGIALNKRRADLPEPVMLDVTVGGPAVGSLHFWQFPAAAWESRQFIPIGSSSVPILSPSFNLIALFVEACEREQLCVRDLLDLECLAQQPLDLELVRVTLAQLHLEHEVKRFTAAAHAAGLAHLLPLLHQIGGQVGKGRASLPVIRGRAYDMAVQALDWLEDRAPNLCLWMYQRIPTQRVYRLGLPVYLFHTAEGAPPGARPNNPSFARNRQHDVVILAGQRYLGRARPLIAEHEIAEQEAIPDDNSHTAPTASI